MISIELWRARIGQFNAKCHSGRTVFYFLFLFYPNLIGGRRRKTNDVSSQDPDPSLTEAVSTATSLPPLIPSPAKDVSSTSSPPDPAPQALVPELVSIPSSYSSGVLQCRSVLREALIILLIAIISQQLLLSAGDVETNPGPLACEFSLAAITRQCGANLIRQLHGMAACASNEVFNTLSMFYACLKISKC